MFQGQQNGNVVNYPKFTNFNPHVQEYLSEDGLLSTTSTHLHGPVVLLITKQKLWLQRNKKKTLKADRETGTTCVLISNSGPPS